MAARNDAAAERLRGYLDRGRTLNAQLDRVQASLATTATRQAKAAEQMRSVDKVGAAIAAAASQLGRLTEAKR